MIEELVARVFALRNAAHLEHWATNSFSKHMALGSFYDDIIDKTDKLVEAVGSGKFDLVVVNYANSDMVGHTGELPAAIKAIEAIDVCLGRLTEAVKKAGGALLVTADHGNSEQMFDEITGQKHTQHTLNRVPALLFNGPANIHSLNDGKLADVAPTMLALMKVPQPPEMTGHSLLSEASRKAILAVPKTGAVAASA